MNDGVDGGVRSKGRWVAVLTPAAILALLFLLYGPLNHGPARWIARTPLDERIPLVPLFAIPYLSIFLVAGVTVVVFWLKSARLLVSGLLAGICTLAVSELCYVFAQTYVARPPLTGDGPLTGLVRLVYGSDQPYNAFPSLHVGFSVLLGVHWLWFDRRSGRLVAAWCGLIAVSTVFVRQHYLADVGGGVVAGGLACAAAAWAVRRNLPEPR